MIYLGVFAGDGEEMRPSGDVWREPNRAIHHMLARSYDANTACPN